VTLPPSLFAADDKGRKGFAEWGFMSTTSKRDVALRYSGVKKGMPFPTILEFTAEAIDRGACIKDLSQYEQEEEYLFPPLSFLAPHGKMRMDGKVKIVPLRVNANLKGLTLEQLRSQKKDRHLSSFRSMVDEVRKELGELAGSEEAAERCAKDANRQYDVKVNCHELVDKILAACNDCLKKQVEIPVEDYEDEAVFRGIVTRALETREMAVSKFRWWLKSTRRMSDVQDTPHTRAHREWIMWRERRVDAIPSEDERRKELFSLCKLKGLVFNSLDERNELGEGPLHRAAAEGASKRSLRLLVKAKANLEERDGHERTALLLAALNGHTETVQQLLEMRADIGATRRFGGTVLMSAAQNGHVETLEFLCRARADVNACHSTGWNAVMAAARYGHTEAVGVLLDNRASPVAWAYSSDGSGRHEGQTALMVAAGSGHTDTVRLLCRRGATPCAKTRDGSTAASWAAATGHAQVLMRMDCRILL
jgi:hypothetical protein